MDTLITVLLAAALICFSLEVFSVQLGTIKLVPLGLALWVASVLIPRGF
jgi:hypothetical protein